MSSAAAAAERSTLLNGLAVLTGQPVQSGTVRERPMRVETASCEELLDPPCSGSATIDSNLSEDASIAPAGSVIALQFEALSGKLFGDSVSMNGGLSIEFLESFDLTADSFDGLHVRLSFSALTVQFNGANYGPITEVGELDISAQGVSSLTSGGRSHTGLSLAQLGSNGSISVQVTASSTAEVVYAVSVTLNGTTTSYTVTASYPAGGGSPSYSAVPA